MGAAGLVHSVLCRSLQQRYGKWKVGACCSSLALDKTNQREDLGINVNQYAHIWIIEMCLQASNQMHVASWWSYPESHTEKAVRSIPKEENLFVTIFQHHLLEGTHLFTIPVPRSHALEGSVTKSWSVSSSLMQQDSL